MPVAIDDFVSTRQVGNAEITLICEMSGSAPVALNVSEETWRAAIPDVATTGRAPSGMTLTVARVDDAVIVIDPGSDDPGTRLHTEVDAAFSSWTSSPGLQVALDALNIVNDEVTHVLITHAHFDHCLGLTIDQDAAPRPRFPRARHFLGKADWRHWSERAAAEPPADENIFAAWGRLEMWPRLQAIQAAGLLDLIDGPATVAPGVTMLPAPGESPGHYVVRIASADGVFYNLGDLVHHWFEFEHLDWVIDEGSKRDVEAMETSRRNLLPRIASESAVVTFSHAPFPGWGRIVGSGDGFRWEPLE